MKIAVIWKLGSDPTALSAGEDTIRIGRRFFSIQGRMDSLLCLHARKSRLTKVLLQRG
jgi:hypothetical protein